MSAKNQNVTSVAAKYRRLVELCDTGFAVAIHIRFTRPSLLFRTYPAAWIDHYNEKGFMMVDPTVRWGLSHTGSMDWDNLADDDQDGVLHAAREFGLENGWSYATGPATSRSLASMTRSSAFTAGQHAEVCSIIDDIHALTEGFDQLPVDTQDAFRAIG